MDGMEYYSSLLWHTRRDDLMASLAHELVDMDRDSAQAWCVLGNCFSLQRDRTQALKCFDRAMKLDPGLAYAYTLCGHEYFAEENWEDAQSCYLKAVHLDVRHYNAW